MRLTSLSSYTHFHFSEVFFIWLPICPVRNKYNQNSSPFYYKRVEIATSTCLRQKPITLNKDHVDVDKHTRTSTILSGLVAIINWFDNVGEGCCGTWSDYKVWTWGEGEGMNRVILESF